MFLRVLICLTISIKSLESSIVITNKGPVRGKLNQDHDVDYYSYEGIPYAESPEGKLRFKAPVPKKPWHSILNATKTGPVCPQAETRYKRSQMSEDCLVLNVYVPANRTGQLSPVFAFIHGGAFRILSGNPDIQYGPQFYLKRGLVFVSMNYRLGALGFLSLQNEDVPGNAGLKDVILALKWINANIAGFGGDNNRITIGGSSSGSAIAHFLMLTDKTKDLFQRVLLTSGSAVSFRFIQKKPIKNALALASKLRLDTEDHKQLIKNLTELDAFTIVDAQQNILQNERSEMRQFSPFVPSIEYESHEAIITQYPLEIIRSGMQHTVPILVGLNSLEGLYTWAAIRKNETLIDNLPRVFAHCIPPDVEYPKDSKPYNNLVTSITELYFGDTILSNFTLHNFLQLLSDTQFTFNIDHWIRVYKNRSSSSPLYYYFFDFEGDLNWAKIRFNLTEFSGTAHSDDLGYWLVTQVTDPLLQNVDSRTQRMMNVMLTLFTNFVKFGNPTPDGYDGPKWQQYSTEGNYLILTDNPTLGTQGPNAERFDFWFSVYQEFYKYVKAGGIVADNDYV